MEIWVFSPEGPRGTTFWQNCGGGHGVVTADAINYGSGVMSVAKILRFWTIKNPFEAELIRFTYCSGKVLILLNFFCRYEMWLINIFIAYWTIQNIIQVKKWFMGSLRCSKCFYEYRNDLNCIDTHLWWYLKPTTCNCRSKVLAGYCSVFVWLKICNQHQKFERKLLLTWYISWCNDHNWKIQFWQEKGLTDSFWCLGHHWKLKMGLRWCSSTIYMIYWCY